MQKFFGIYVLNSQSGRNLNKSEQRETNGWMSRLNISKTLKDLFQCNIVFSSDASCIKA